MRDPLGYADILDEYVLVLKNTGKEEETEKYQKRANQLRSTYPGKKSLTDITPYGTQCSK